MTTEEVEAEVERAKNSPLVKLTERILVEAQRCAQCDCALEDESYGDGYCRECFYEPCSDCGEHLCRCDEGVDQ